MNKLIIILNKFFCFKLNKYIFEYFVYLDKNNNLTNDITDKIKTIYLDKVLSYDEETASQNSFDFINRTKLINNKYKKFLKQI